LAWGGIFYGLLELSYERFRLYFKGLRDYGGDLRPLGLYFWLVDKFYFILSDYKAYKFCESN
jgi:hypothetical protein